jgi:hypothetical protein
MRLIVSITLLVLLVSCGGGGSTTPPVDYTPVDRSGTATVTFSSDSFGWTIEASYGTTTSDKEVVWTDVIDPSDEMTVNIPYDMNKGRLYIDYKTWPDGTPCAKFNIIDSKGTYEFQIMDWFSE